MTWEASISSSLTARISVQANIHAVDVKARSAGRSQNPRIIEAKLQGYLS
jgi:hypothetical protein